MAILWVEYIDEHIERRSFSSVNQAREHFEYIDDTEVYGAWIDFEGTQINLC